MHERPRTILFCLIPEYGAYYATLELSRALRARGHRVVHLVAPDVEPIARAQGLESIPFFEDLFPQGWAASTIPIEREGKLERLRHRVARLRRASTLLARTVDALDLVLARESVDLVVVDSHLSRLAVSPLRRRVPVLAVCHDLMSLPNPRTPPATTEIVPDDTRLSGLQVRAAWAATGLRAARSRAAEALLTIGAPRPFRLEREARRLGREVVVGDYDGRRLVLPELVPYPPAFDFPAAMRWPHRRHLGPSIDLDRREVDFPWARIAPNLPLVLSSLGTNSEHYPHARRFFEAVLRAARLRPDRQFVVSVSEGRAADEFGALPGNVVLAQRVPQLALLRRASLFVTNGGFNSVRESVWFGVPMLVLPAIDDQPGIAARVRAHRLGLSASLRTIDGGELSALIARVESDTSIAASTRAMSQKFRDDRSFADALRFVERFGAAP